MQIFHLTWSLTIPLCYGLFIPFVDCVSHERANGSSNRTEKSIKDNIDHKLSPQMTSNITMHGLLLWCSMGFLMPVGILTIRMANRDQAGRRAKFLFYLHVILQTLSVLLSTIGAVMSIRSFENSFNNDHQRLGLALYGAMWVQALIGFYRAPRGNKMRYTWYFVHWILGTMTSLMGIINVYTGLKAYHKKTLRSTRLWTILFTAQVSFMAFFYLFQDKWEHIQKQGDSLGNDINDLIINAPTNQMVITTQSLRDNEKILLPQPCDKQNALKNLFD